MARTVPTPAPTTILSGSPMSTPLLTAPRSAGHAPTPPPSEPHEALDVAVHATRAYGVADAGDDSWTCHASPDGQWRLPLVVSAAGTPHAASPYGYSGVHVAPGLQPSQVRELWHDAAADLRGRGVASVFLRLSPLDLASTSRLTGLPGLHLRHVSDTVLVDSRDLDEAWAEVASSCRRQVRKAERRGLTATVDPVATFTAGDGAAFRHLYDDTMRRLGAHASYFRDDRYYERLGSLGPDRLKLCSVRDDSGAMVAAALLLVDRDAVHYHYAGSDADAGRPHGATNLLIWSIVRWAHEQGIPGVHLGGGRGRDDSLLRFKRSFGGALRPFVVGTSVLDAHAYALGVHDRARELGVRAEALLGSDFFPAHRAPAPAPVTGSPEQAVGGVAP